MTPASPPDLADLDLVFDGMPQGLILTDLDGVVRRANPAFLRLVGGDVTAYVGRTWAEVVQPADRTKEERVLADVGSGRRSSTVRELVLPRPGAEPAPVLVTSSMARRPDGSGGVVVMRIEDITSRRQAEVELRETQSALDGIITVDDRDCIVSWNDGATRLLGYERSAVVGRPVSMIVPEDVRAALAATFAERYSNTGPIDLADTVETEVVAEDGRRLPVEVSLSAWRQGGEPFYTAVLRDISERRRHEDELAWRASHDPATGLPNMAALGQWYDAHCRDLDETRLRAVFCLQLTNLSRVSAALGAEASQDLLRLIGESFAEASRPDLVVGHLRDTHFGGAVALEPDRADAFDTRLRAIARYVVDAVAASYLITGIRVEMQVHLGIVATRQRTLTFLEMLRQAEATRDASARHVNVADEIFTAGDPRGPRDLSTLSDMYDAVSGEQLELHYQPLTALQPRPASRDGEPTTAPPQLVEALLRWHHPTRGLVSPGEFIPLIEDSRLMLTVTDWVLHEALTQQVSWREAGLDVRVAVNVSPQVLLNDDVVMLVRRALTDTGAAASRLKVEITESAIVDDPEQAREIVAELREVGVLVCLDDFGTGYTSLRLLRDFAVDEIKLDRLFVANATVAPADAAIANVVGQLGQRLGVRTVAEGVEDVETRSLFRAFGYDYMQGFLDSRPLPAAQIEDWLRGHRPVCDRSCAG